MTIQTTELIDSVDRFHQNSSTEGDYRGVCSRAYYAIYDDGRMFHDGLPVPGNVKKDSRGGKHQDLYERLQNPGIKSSNKDYFKSIAVGALMATLYAKRIKSDYHRDKVVTRSDAESSVLECKNVAEKLQSAQAVGTAAPPPAPEKRPSLTRIK